MAWLLVACHAASHPANPPPMTTMQSRNEVLTQDHLALPSDVRGNHKFMADAAPAEVWEGGAGEKGDASSFVGEGGFQMDDHPHRLPCESANRVTPFEHCNFLFGNIP